MRASLALLLAALVSSSAFAQTKLAAPPAQNRSPQKPASPAKPAPAQKPATQTRTPTRSRSNEIRPRAFASFGGVTFQAQESFDAILGTHSGPMYGGGGQVLLPWGLYAEVGVWQFTRDGERVFVGPNREVFQLGIPLEVTIRPIEITGGWRYRHCPGPPRPPRAPQPPPGTPQKPGTTPSPQPQRVTQATPTVPCDPKFVPYAGAGFSSFQYRETSEFADSGESLDERFKGFHLVGGAEYRLMRWVAVGGEFTWSSVRDALGAGGVSAAFDESDLGGAALRLKVTVGR